MVRRGLLGVLFFGAATMALAFLTLPLVAIFVRVPRGASSTSSRTRS